MKRAQGILELAAIIFVGLGLIAFIAVATKFAQCATQNPSQLGSCLTNFTNEIPEVQTAQQIQEDCKDGLGLNCSITLLTTQAEQKLEEQTKP